MRDAFKKCMNYQIVEPFAVGVISVLALEFIIYPGLTIASTVLNLISGSLLIGLIIFIVSYVKLRYFDKKENEEVETPESGETELDYVNPEELKPKKKRNPKQTFDGVDETKPFVKTKMNAKPKKNSK